jgi:ATP-dependent Clp protease ATP-binding subunit ClpA
MAGHNLQWFSERARSIIEAAEEAANYWRYEEISSEHLLLALMRSSEFSSILYTRIGLNRTIAMKRIIGDHQHDVTTPTNTLPLSDDFKQIIKAAIDDMRKSMHSFVHPEHILMGMTRFPKCAAIRIINEQNVGLSELQRQVARLIDERETFFDYDILPRTTTKVGNAYYDGQPIRILILNSVTSAPIADLIMTASEFREMASQTRLRLQAGHYGDVFTNVFGDYQITISIQKAEV